MRRILALLLISAGLFANTAKLDGGDVYYEAHGKGPRTVVLIHGWTCDHTFWREQEQALAAKYKVIALDLPGHGRSSAAREYSISLFARAVDAVMRAERAGKATLMGHSMGGAVILEFSRLFPQKLDGVVLVDAFMRDAAAAASGGKFHERFAGQEGNAARRKMVEGMFSAASTPAVREHVLSRMLAAPESTAVGAMKAMFMPEVWREGQSPVPALAVVANPRQITEASLKARFPNLTYRDMPGTGHFLMMEMPAEFNAIVLEWLQRR
jgi:pimeloyl-ACP methyl ester carboxylesterase